MPIATRTVRIAVASLVALVLLPGAALACSLAWDEPEVVPAADIRMPVRRESSRAAWSLGDFGWVSMRPYLTGAYDVAGDSKPPRVGIAVRQQRNLSFVSDHRRGLQVFRSDADDATPACALDGQQVWTRPRLLTRVRDRAVFVVFVTRRLSGDRAGCVVKWEGGGACEDVAIGSVRLADPLGDRRLVLDWFPA